MPYQVEVLIKYRDELRDPEGETIHRHLILRRGYGSVKRVRVGKYILMEVDAATPDEAAALVRGLCERLRIYNPVIHDLEVRVRG